MGKEGSEVIECLHPGYIHISVILEWNCGRATSRRRGDLQRDLCYNCEPFDRAAKEVEEDKGGVLGTWSGDGYIPM